MTPGPSKRRLVRAFGLARSLAMYHAIPFRAKRLARLYAPFVARGDVCFDVGAHAGNRTRCWRRLGARVVAVEPQPDLVRLLRMLYRNDSAVAIEPIALGREPGVATLLASEATPTVSTLSRAWIEQVRAGAGFERVRWTRKIEVPVGTLDQLIERHGVPAFIKIDVEGYEAEVIAGLTTPVRALSFEYLASARGVAIACIERLATLGTYSYRWSAGESHRLVEGHWLDAREMTDTLEALPADAGSGDVYARLARL